MPAKDAQAQGFDEADIERRKKTPLWMLAGASALGLGLFGYGFSNTMDVEDAAIQNEPRTTRAATVQASSFGEALSKSRPVEPPPPKDAANAPWGAVPQPGQGTGAFVAPTQAVPSIGAGPGAGPTKGLKCADLPTLQARMDCLDEHFQFEMRKDQLQELGEGIRNEDTAFGRMPGEVRSSERSSDMADERRRVVPSVPRAAAAGSVSPFAMGGSGSPFAMEASNKDRRRESTRAAFHRTGGRDQRPERKVGSVRKPDSPFWLGTGSLLPCAFISGVTSALPGQIEAQITRNVYDSVNQTHLLAPAGSRLVGMINPEVDEGQQRVQIGWLELHFPDGRYLDLGGMSGADGAGYAGVRGRVNRHWLQKLGLALMTSSVNVAFHLAAPNRDRSGPQDAVAQGVGEGVIQTANEGLKKMMRIPDVIEIRPGQVCAVKVERSIDFEQAYDDGKRWRR